MQIDHFKNTIPSKEIPALLKKLRYGVLNLRRLPKGHIVKQCMLYYPYWVIDYYAPSPVKKKNGSFSRIRVLVDAVEGVSGIMDGTPEQTSAEIDDMYVFKQNILEDKAIELGKKESQLFAARYWKTIKTIFDVERSSLVHKPLMSIHYHGDNGTEYLVLLDGVSHAGKILEGNQENIDYFLREVSGANQP